jgi:hypothetical protein
MDLSLWGVTSPPMQVQRIMEMGFLEVAAKEALEQSGTRTCCSL